MRQSILKKVSRSGRDEMFSTLIRELRSHFVLHDCSVLLIGSVARKTITKWSDIDLVVISARTLKPWIPPTGIHIQFETRENFLKRLKRREDFPAWALHFGKVLYDDGWWENISKETALLNIWPDWRLKLVHAKHRLKMANALKEIGDVSASWEEYLYAASHMARAVLLAAHHFPLSRGELSGQLSAIGEKELAYYIKQLINGEPHRKTLDEISEKINWRLKILEQISDNKFAGV